MYCLRCTKKLLDRGVGTVAQQCSTPSTVLGDWYANIAFVRPQHVVLCVSERSLLPVLLPAKDIKTLRSRLSHTVAEMLLRVGIPRAQIEREIAEMGESITGKTASRRLVGCMNEFMFHFRSGCASDTALSLEERAYALATMPMSAIDFVFPAEQTAQLFRAYANGGDTSPAA